CATRLAELHRLIAADFTARPVAAASLVHVGDYVDRGPASRAVITMLAKGPPVAGMTIVNLTGNHEQMLLKTLASLDPDDIEAWLANGGEETLLSWDIGPDATPEEWNAAFKAWELAFMRDLALTHQAGGYLFVHAGIRPGLALDRQSRDDLLWIREPFLSSDADLGAVVVHGHTPVSAPLVRANRIDIDTGAYLGGDLTCAILEEDRIGFLFA
ncbi:MAG: metallophosphoesterase, partial [Anaerolineae bacterium]|nr:metallophosphoesterase [Anaerolineae bacterium]